MVSKLITFGAGNIMTPDLAAKLAHKASLYAAEVSIECDNVQLCVDSLIGILSMNLKKGMRLTLIANGDDEQSALEHISSLLEAQDQK